MVVVVCAWTLSYQSSLVLFDWFLPRYTRCDSDEKREERDRMTMMMVVMLLLMCDGV